MAQPKLVINQEKLEELRDGQPWGVFAKLIGIDKGTLSRIRHGESQPGSQFIAKIITQYPVRMDEIVDVESAA
ncbi:MAG TPA: hypothetical protein DEV93_15025 [Chloroflexi bacterium]|jgi:transcriptional regulator with XRE-family HTH domain|nr:hypothetical protein [Chloroflexota bacterium]